MSNRPLPMRNMADMSDSEQAELLRQMNSYLAGVLAQILMDKTAPAPTATGRRDAPTLDAQTVIAEAEAILL